jgi:hypothetical protein
MGDLADGDASSADSCGTQLAVRAKMMSEMRVKD